VQDIPFSIVGRILGATYYAFFALTLAFKQTSTQLHKNLNQPD